MKDKIVSIVILAVALAAPGHAEGQVVGPGGVATVITFSMQLNMTNLSSDLGRLRLVCAIQSTALASPGQYSTAPGDLVNQLPGADFYPAQGKAVGTLSVQFPVATALLAPDALGKEATYSCILLGYSISLQRWDSFSEQQTAPAFRVSPGSMWMTGKFVW